MFDPTILSRQSAEVEEMQILHKMSVYRVMSGTSLNI